MTDNEFNIDPYELVINSFNKPLSVKEQQQIAAWRSSSSENEQLYQQLYLINEDIELLPVYQKIDTDASWNKFKLLLKKDKNLAEVIDLKPRHSNYQKKLKWFLPIAASLLIFIWFSIHKYNDKNAFTVVHTGAHEHKKITLPDGTEVLLNQNTTVSYDADGYVRERTLDIKSGEAFFNVIHNAKKPFRVKIDKIAVNDIGTSFNIRKETHAIVVVVNSGIVSLTNQVNGKSVIVNAKQKGIYNVTSNNITSGANDEINYKAWADRNLQFIKTPLIDVVKELADDYGTEIDIKDNSLNNKTLTASFNNQPIDSVLNVISLSLRIKVEKRNKVFQLRTSPL
ncbi:MAG: transrane sensor [Mucilaginibacter sp.]|nr:transrane sensor [Mucilaginibacter sp.]